MKPLFDPHHAWFDKAWARYLTVFAPLAWAGVEFYHAQPLWGAAFALAGLYAGYMLFIVRVRGK